MFDIPALSPYQSPEILDKLFYKYDLYCIDRKKDLRIKIGENLFNKKVTYPHINLTPEPYERKRVNQIKIYISYLKFNKIEIRSKLTLSYIYYLYSLIAVKLDKYSSKRRGKISIFLYYARNIISYLIPYFKNNRFDIKKKEIK